ncbi:uncharacterized protein MONBRDRAFT_35487 [Monosiga brevicollis MX1]|uniref:Uncharacterized protein n=1 Tax=Monosiga brevicollis TaxID=81824 RepID=A9UPE6_MONBE|nr:uncharacterized protein MONBRDRAFT_35487 [Monosiga brevicollis MX1]EDQ92406.1 predicted protein [Monosiga brevicollis MX1]|eukprot:XP_001742168.1 hypothetical protein [Monosiga brevicollis MX1]
MAASLNRVYAVDPLFQLQDGDVRIASNMYTMDPLILTEVAAPGAASGSREQILERRQLNILSQLHQLEQKLDKLLGGGAAGPKQGKHGEILPGSDAANPKPAAVDVALSMNPKSPAKVALTVAAWLQQREHKTCDVRQFWHSTLSDQPAHFREHATLPAAKLPCDLRLNIIYKDEAEAVLRASPASDAAMKGDLNAARYLCRSFGSALYPNNPMLALQVDECLDYVNDLATGTSKEAKPALKALNEKLGKSAHLVGTSMTLADIGLFFAAQSTKASSLPSNIKKFVKEHEADSLFVFANDVLACLA